MDIGLIIWIFFFGLGIFGSIFVAVLIHNLNYYRETKNEGLKLKLQLLKEINKLKRK